MTILKSGEWTFLEATHWIYLTNCSRGKIFFFFLSFIWSKRKTCQTKNMIHTLNVVAGIYLFRFNCLFCVFLSDGVNRRQKNIISKCYKSCIAIRCCFRKQFIKKKISCLPANRWQKNKRKIWNAIRRTLIRLKWAEEVK